MNIEDSIAQLEADATRLSAIVEQLFAELPGTIEPQQKKTTHMDLRMAQNRIPDEVLALLRTISITDCQARLAQRTDPKLYRHVKTILDNLGGRWDRKAQAHVFTDDPRAQLAHVLATGRYSKLDRLGFFPTSDPLKNRVVDLADIKAHHKTLEPSAGDGRLADEVRRRFPLIDLSCCEIQPGLRQKLIAKGHHLVPEPDFLNYRTAIQYDRIVMNPPFEAQADIDHVLHAYDLLAPNGKLVSIMAEGITFRKNQKAKAFRTFMGPLPKLPGIHGHIEINPEGSFKEAGTNVNTVTIVLVKD